MTKSINIENLDWDTRADGPGNYEVDRKHLTPHTDRCNLGCSLYRIKPGHKAFPAHYHFGNDEAIYVLSGLLTVTLDGVSQQLGAGSYITFKAASEVAHQVSNTSGDMVEFLCMSTMNKTDIVVYPDSGKIGVMGGYAPGGEETDSFLREWMKLKPVDYWLDEEG